MGNLAILATTTHSAFRGYAWSHLPPGINEAELDGLRRLASEERGDFPEPADISRGLVSDGRIAACYSIRTVTGWDSENNIPLSFSYREGRYLVEYRDTGSGDGTYGMNGDWNVYYDFKVMEYKAGE